MGWHEWLSRLAKLPAGDRDKLKPQVADLTAVLREIIKAKDDSYIFFPTPEYFRLVQQNQNQSGAAAGSGSGKP